MNTVVAVERNARRFPLELETIILLSRKKDRNFLAKCSLVCSEWRFITRQHLFSTLLVRASELQKLIDFSARYHENSFIKHLSSFKISGETGRQTRINPLAQNPFYISPDDGFCAKTFQSITALSLFNVIFRNIWDLIDVVGQFSALETLFIRYQLHPSGTRPLQSLDQSPAIAPISPDRFPKGLKTLSLDVGSQNLSLFYTLIIGLASQVDTYQLYSIGRIDLPYLEGYIYAAGRQGPEDQQWDLDIGSDRSLRSAESLVQYVNLPRDNNKITGLRLGGFLNWSGVVRLLTSFQSEAQGRLKYIALPEVRLKVPGYQEHLVALDGVLRSPYFSGVKEVRFVVVPDSSDVKGSVSAFFEILNCGCQRRRIYKPRVYKMKVVD